ncbi:MAG TPA: MFS transporter [Lacisediminihabitans sp.]|uniref:MFS transporter n=1 Tax=Lacisediminihabitans sp. TaxID=2787631 RepID=UPI002ED88ADF
MTIIEQSYGTRSVGLKLGILAAALFVVGTNAFVIAGVLPAIAASLGVTASAVSFSITWYAVVVAVASPVVSVVFARMPRTRLMAGGLALIAVGTVVAAAAGSLEMFTVGRVLAALGGAALVPAATAAAPSLVPPEQRGRALAATGLGFTLATAIGSPFGTFLAELGGWRLALGVLAGLAAVLTVVLAVLVRGIPTGPALSFPARFAVLGNSRILLGLLATLLMVIAFNVVYVFSSTVARPATGGDGTLLALLLLAYGAFGILGNWLGGRLTDRIGGRWAALAGLVVEAAALLALIPARSSLPATAVLFAVWGVATYTAIVPVQHRLAAIDPDRAGISLSWYSTAMYVGIALAPVIGAAVLASGATLLLIIAAAAAVAAAIVFESGHRGIRPRSRS